MATVIPDPENGSSGRREGRGRLSSIEMLPEECDEDIAWANAELIEKKMPQTEILRQFNARLADRGIPPISKGAFSRYSVRLAIDLRKMDAQRRITDAVLAQMKPGERGDSMIAATELVKYRLLELVMASEDDPKLLINATLALQRLSATVAREAEIQRRERKDQKDEQKEAAEADAQKAAAAEAADKVQKIGEEAGLGADRIAAIRRGVLGLAA